MSLGRQTGSPQRRYAVTHLTHYRQWETETEFGRSCQNLGRKSPLVVAVKGTNMDFDLVGQGEGRI